MTLRYKDISEIIGLIDSSSCDEFVLETDEVKLVLRRRSAGSGHPADPISAAALADSAPRSATSSRSANPAAPGSDPKAASLAATGTRDLPGVVIAPIVGTFYRAPSPDEPPFAEVGTKVKAGDPLCIIEVMKLFTTIHAEIAGTVKEIGAENGQLVEYGQMLFLIEPD